MLAGSDDEAETSLLKFQLSWVFLAKLTPTHPRFINISFAINTLEQTDFGRRSSSSSSSHGGGTTLPLPQARLVTRRRVVGQPDPLEAQHWLRVHRRRLGLHRDRPSILRAGGGIRAKGRRRKERELVTLKRELSYFCESGRPFRCTRLMPAELVLEGNLVCWR